MNKTKLTAGFLLVLLLTVPWFNLDSNNEYSIAKVSQEDVSFYEINPCKISLVSFLISNPESSYQNHYYFRSDNYSSIKCFGRVTGVTVLEKGGETQFYISVGTNSLLNLLLQGVFWITLLTFIPKNKTPYVIRGKSHNIILLITSYFYTFSIYAESRFYEKNLYIFEFTELKSYFLTFIIFLFLSKNLVEIFLNRSENFLNYLPYIFLITGLFSGFNIVFFGIVFVFYGIQLLLQGRGNTLFNYVYVLLSIRWLFNSRGSFYFNVGKIRGFTSSIFEFNANLFYILFTYFIIMGIWSLFKKTKDKFSISCFTKNLSYVSVLLLSFGSLSSNLPIFNFFSYYFLGLQRYGVGSNNPFAYDENLVRISWRGIFPSSETIGEFYGICLIFILFYIVNKQKVRFSEYIGIFSAGFGLYFSDNRAAIILTFLITCIYLYLNNFKFLNTKLLKISSLITFIVLVLYAQLSQDFLSSYEFMSESVFTKAKGFQYDTVFSSYLLLLNDSFQQSTLFSYFFSFISFIAYILNRSEMWGLFFTRYNPSFMEVLFGSGPLNFGQLYGEVVVNNPDSFLLPHSSILSYILFIGIVPVLILLLIFGYHIIKNKKNYEFLLLSGFILLNIVKNDSMNYFSSFTFYAFLILLFNNRISSNNFNKPFLKKNV
tara:strand:+ start:407 stop:2377 length:1971 start_codon:yes stop_codon:yes gene_type:complete